MSAITYLDNDIKLQYRDLVCTDKDTDFLNKYLELPELRRLDLILQFCGCDYTNIHDSISARFTSLDHSLITAKMAYHFTNSKAQAIAALFHDVLSPAFRHSNDFRKGDALRQESSETNEYNTFIPSDKLIEYLNVDGVTVEDILDIKKYPILENNSPRLCTDRLDGIIHTNLIWRPYFTISDVEKIYNDITVLKNEDGQPEIGFKNIKIALEFGKGIYNYAKALQLNETNYSLQFVGDILQTLINEKLITDEDLYKLSEIDEIIDIIYNSRLRETWKTFNNATEIVRCNRKPKDVYYYSTSTMVKKRYVDPLCVYNNKVYRLREISNEFNNLLNDYFNFKDSKYCYVKDIRNFH